METLNFIPVNPARTKKGALAALVKSLGSESAATPTALDTSAQLLNFRVASDAVSVSVAASLNLGAIFTGSTSADDKGFYFDAMAYTDQVEVSPTAAISAVRWGIGLRVLLLVTNISVKTALNFSMVAAAVELQQARAQYEVSGLGLGIEGFNIVLQELGSEAVGDFKYETYLKLRGAVVQKLGAYIESHKADLKPQPVAVSIRTPVYPLDEAQPIYFVMRCIESKLPLSETLLRVKNRFDSKSVRDIYTRTAHTTGDLERPSDDVVRQAKQWLVF